MPDKRKSRDQLTDRMRNYYLFLQWLKVNNKRLLQIAYQQFVEETGITV